jgi:hypothetical protein
VYAWTLHRALGGLALFAFLAWMCSAHGLSAAGLAGFFFQLTERSEDISHG